MEKNKQISIALQILIVALIVAGCGPRDQESEPTESSRALQIGVPDDFPPFAYLDEQSNALDGFYIDLMNEIAEDIDYQVDYVSFDVEDRMTSLEQCTYDALFTYYSEGEDEPYCVKYYDRDTGRFLYEICSDEEDIFTEPVFDLGLVIVTARDSDIRDVSDLDGHRQGILEADSHRAPPGTSFATRFLDVDSLSQALSDGQIDAAIVNHLDAYSVLQRVGKEFVITGEPITEQFLSIAVCDTELRQGINEALTEMKSNGEYSELQDAWFPTE